MSRERTIRTLLWALIALLLFAQSCGRGDEDAEPGAVLKKDDLAMAREVLGNMRDGVELIGFTGKGCPTCNQAEVLFEEIAGIQDLVTYRKLDVHQEAEEASKYGIDHVPSVVVKAGEDVGIRFFGLPVSMELEPFLDTISRLSRGDPHVSPITVSMLESLKDPVNIKVFVTSS
jgi:hypothetical protein